MSDFQTHRTINGTKFRLCFSRVQTGERAGQWSLNAYLPGSGYPFHFCVYPTEKGCLDSLKRKAKP